MKKKVVTPSLFGEDEAVIPVRKELNESAPVVHKKERIGNLINFGLSGIKDFGSWIKNNRSNKTPEND